MAGSGPTPPRPGLPTARNLVATTNWYRGGVTTTTRTDVETVEAALAVIVRRASLPRLHQHVVDTAGVTLDRALVIVLGRIADEGPLRLTDLAPALAVDVSTVSRQVKQLVELQLVRRSPDPSDGRCAFVSATARGRRTVERVRTSRRETVARLLERWTPAEVAGLADTLGRLADDVVAYTDGL